jgi:hypothetical protein
MCRLSDEPPSDYSWDYLNIMLAEVVFNDEELRFSTFQSKQKLHLRPERIKPILYNKEQLTS